MRRTLVVLLVALAALVAAAAASEPQQKHHFETPKGTVIVTVQHGNPGQQAAAPAAAESSSEESSSEESSSEESSAASEESSSEESSNTEAEAEKALGELSHFTLPPEPPAAKGYKSLSCGNDDPCDEARQEQEQPVAAPCTDNCEAQEAVQNQAAGRVVLSQPLGAEAATDGNYVPAVGSRTGGPSVDASSWTVAPQTGVAGLVSNTAMPSAAPAAVPVAAPAVPVSAGLPTNDCGDSCGAPYETPAQRRQQRMEKIEQLEKAQRAQEKAKLHHVMQAHEANLAKIEAMSRSLRWQYTQLRRQHQMLRTHISANKAVYNELGGDNEYKGTDLDIETSPNTYETLDDIPAGGAVEADAAGIKRIGDTVNRHHDDQAAMLSGLHRQQKKTVQSIVGSGAAGGRSAADAAIAEAEAAKF